MTPLIDREAEQRRRYHLTLIHEHWNYLASLSYSFLIANGRGMLLIIDSKEEPWWSGIFYFNAREINIIAGPKEAGWIESYDPSDTVLFGFLRRDGIACYKVTGKRKKPARCYLRMIASAN